MTLRPFAFEAERSSVFAEARGIGWIDAFGQIQTFRFLLGPYRSQDAFRCKWRFMQPHADCVVDRIGDGRNRSGKRSFAALLGAEWTLGIDALDDDRLDLRRLDRRRTAVLEQTGIHQHPVFPDHFFGESLSHAHPDRAYDLPLNRNRIERAPAIMRRPDFVNRDLARLFVNADFR